MRQSLCRAHIVILFFYFSIVGNVNLYFIKLASDVTLNCNFIKLNDQAEKLIKLNFRMVNLNANMVNVTKKSYTFRAAFFKFCRQIAVSTENIYINHILRINLQSCN